MNDFYQPLFEYVEDYWDNIKSGDGTNGLLEDLNGTTYYFSLDKDALPGDWFTSTEEGEDMDRIDIIECKLELDFSKEFEDIKLTDKIFLAEQSTVLLPSTTKLKIYIEKIFQFTYIVPKAVYDILL